MKSGTGHLGHGVHTGIGHEYSVPLYQVVGSLVGAPTSASTIGTGAHDFNLDIAAGLVVIDGAVKEFVAQADLSLSESGSGPPTDMGTGDSIIYSIIAYKSLQDGDIRQAVVAGDVAVDASALPPAQATIEALFATGTPWYEIGRSKINRTADATLTQTYDNRVRPLGIPDPHLKVLA